MVNSDNFTNTDRIVIYFTKRLKICRINWKAVLQNSTCNAEKILNGCNALVWRKSIYFERKSGPPLDVFNPSILRVLKGKHIWEQLVEMLDNNGIQYIVFSDECMDILIFKFSDTGLQIILTGWKNNIHNTLKMLMLELCHFALSSLNVVWVVRTINPDPKYFYIMVFIYYVLNYKNFLHKINA